MNILLTGGAGYIGSHIAVVLASSGHDPVLLDNFTNSSPTVISKIEKITGRKQPFYNLDIRDTEKLSQVMRVHEIEAVIHLAGLKSVGESVNAPIEYYANNVQGTISLALAMKKVELKRLVFSSSATVYGQPNYLPIDESHPLQPTNPYGRNKLQAEQILQDLAESDPNWSICCLRYFNPVGAHETGMIGEFPKGVPNNLMPLIAEVASRHRKKLTVFGGDYDTFDGTGVRDYIHVMDLAEGHLAALKFLFKNNGIEFINLGNGSGLSVLEMIAKFEEVSGVEIPYEIADRRPGDIAACYADPLKANSILSWHATRDLQNMCDSLWRWEIQRKS